MRARHRCTARACHRTGEGAPPRRASVSYCPPHGLCNRRERYRFVAALREAGISATGGIAVARGSRRLRHLYADADAALLAAKGARTRAVGASQHLSRRKEVESIDELNVA